MKTFLTLMLLCFTFTACQQQEREYMLDEDAFSDGNKNAFYTDADGNPINGKVRSTRVKTDNITTIRTVKDGFMYGTTNVYKNGQIFWRIDYKDGRFHGKVISYYDNGKKRAEDNHINGLLDGRYTYYNEDGSVHVKVWTDNGHYVKGVYYDYLSFGWIKVPVKLPFTEKEKAEWEQMSARWLVQKR